MTYKVSLYAFEGPLDLLYHLVKKKEVNIYDIPISEITDDYLEYIREWKEMDIEVASEFLVMAANLMEIKSQMLLPSSPVVDEKEDEPDPRQDLVKRLIEYKFFKNIAETLANKEEEQKKVYTKMMPEDVEKGYEVNSDQESPDTYFENLNVISLLEAFNSVVEKKTRASNVKTELENITNSKITVTVTEKKTLLIDNLESSSKGGIVFQDFMEENSSSAQELVISFLALLDLVKEGKVDVLQEGVFAPIWIKLLKEREL